MIQEIIKKEKAAKLRTSYESFFINKPVTDDEILVLLVYLTYARNGIMEKYKEFACHAFFITPDIYDANIDKVLGNLRPDIFLE